MDYSHLVLGTVQFGLRYGIANTSGQVSFDEVCKILKLAAEYGITTLDTAAAYGESETVLGRAIAKTGLKDKFQIISKVKPIPDNVNVDEFIRDSVVNSLKNLNLSSLPLVLLHREENCIYLPVLENLKKEGLIQNCGISIDSQAYPKEIENLYAIQHPCNILDHRFDALISKRAKLGLQTFFRSAYLQGVLAMPEKAIPENLRELIPWRKKLEEFAMPLKELALRYVLSFAGKTGLLFGVDSSEQFMENVNLTAKGALDKETFEQVSKCVPLLPERLIRPCLWNKK